MPTKKPIFGPDPSPSIFRAKWLRHFSKPALRLLAIQRTKKHNIRRTEEFAEQLRIELLGLDYISIFSAEAQKLGLQESDFETEALPFEDRHVSSTPYVNPHTFVDDLKSRIELAAQTLLAQKQGRVPTSTPWREMPLRTRRVANEILWKREQAIQRGIWELSPTAQEVVNALMSASLTLNDPNASVEQKDEIWAAMLRRQEQFEAKEEGERGEMKSGD